MSGARRAYDLIRGYINHGWDQITDSEEDQAQRELREAIENPPATQARSVSQEPPEAPITLEQARKLFDLQANANSKQIEQAYENLRSSTDLDKFQEGSAAWQRARAIRRRIELARNILIDNIDPTVRRFEKLEIE